MGSASATQLQADEYTKILMHFDNGNGNTTFEDETGRVWAGVNGITQSTGSIFDGSTSSLLTSRSADRYVRSSNVTGLCPGTQDWTIEFQAKRNTVGTEQRIFGNTKADALLRNATFDIRFVGTTGKIRAAFGNGATYKAIDSISSVNDTDWHTYTIERKGRYAVILQDMKYFGCTDLGESYSLLDSDTQFAIGTTGLATYPAFDGYIDEFRYSVGIARVSEDWMDWYFIGDSNTDATNTGLTPNDGSWCYVFSMVANGNNVTGDHAIGGYGMLSSWGVSNMNAYYPYPKNYGIMLGSNDAHTGRSAATAATNVKTMYDWAVANGSNAVILVPPMAVDTGGYLALAYQQQWMHDFQNNLTGYKYIKAYDATDTNPGNGEPGAINASLFESDGLHLNENGQTALGNYIWSQLRGDFTASHVSGDAPLKVKITHSNQMFPASSMICDFNNDGVTDSNRTNPVHTYGSAGDYTINLTVNNTYGYFPHVKTNYITATSQTSPSTLEQYWNVLMNFLFGLTLQGARI